MLCAVSPMTTPRAMDRSTIKTNSSKWSLKLWRISISTSGGGGTAAGGVSESIMM